MAIRLASFLWLLAVPPMLGAPAGESCAVAGGDGCTSEVDDVGLAQLRVKSPHSIAQAALGTDVQHVPCTFGTTRCAGNQCCPPVPETGNKSYPCPSASPGWNECEGSAPQHVQCPFGGGMCSGDQCCPRAPQSGNKTYPCPSATDGWNECEGSKGSTQYDLCYIHSGCACPKQPTFKANVWVCDDVSDADVLIGNFGCIPAVTCEPCAISSGCQRELNLYPTYENGAWTCEGPNDPCR